MMTTGNIDTRAHEPISEGLLKRAINTDQADTLRALEHFGWVIKFVRRQAGGNSIAVVFDPDKKVLAVIEPDGSLKESPRMAFRRPC